MDADKQGFLRSERSLIQTIGRCARNQNGHVIMYADKISDAMNISIKETTRRREIQNEYNKKHNIIPKTITKSIKEVVSNEIEEKIENEMREAAKNLDFEKAMELRDILFELKSEYVYNIDR